MYLRIIHYMFWSPSFGYLYFVDAVDLCLHLSSCWDLNWLQIECGLVICLNPKTAA
jgi:hypothetical protein